MRRHGAIAMICTEAAQIISDRLFSTAERLEEFKEAIIDENLSITKQLEELKEEMIELELQARANFEMLEIFDFNFLDLLTQSKHNINAIRRKRVHMPSAPWIKKSWKVKTTIRGRLPHY